VFIGVEYGVKVRSNKNFCVFVNLTGRTVITERRRLRRACVHVERCGRTVKINIGNFKRSLDQNDPCG